MEIPADFPPTGEREGDPLIERWATLWSRARDWVSKTEIQTGIAKVGAAPFLSRFTSHLMVILVALSATLVGKGGIPSLALPGLRSIPTPAPSQGLRLYADLSARGGIRFQDENTIVRAPVPHELCPNSHSYPYRYSCPDSYFHTYVYSYPHSHPDCYSHADAYPYSHHRTHRRARPIAATGGHRLHGTDR